MLPTVAESLVERVRRAPGQAKEAVLGTLKGCFDAVKGSDSIRGEIGKTAGMALKTPLETGAGVLSAGKTLLQKHPYQATKEIAGTFIETTKNIAKLGVSPISGASTVARSGIRTCGKILKSPGALAFGAFHTAQRINERLFLLGEQFDKWNKEGVEEKPPTDVKAQVEGKPKISKKEKLANLMSIPVENSDTEQPAQPEEQIPAAETPKEEIKQAA
ncbi:hypothetical protein JW758_03560 [Candidatus Peregrinibacteria bacterium]|nr:hypothetical protein [Candidatus Peregrinibacteria bacterium]